MTKAKPKPVEPEEEVSEAEVRTFTSWKLDLLETINADPATMPADLAIMEAYLHFARARSRTAYLSAIHLRVRTGIASEATIWRRRRVLIDLGYLVPDGRTRTGVEVFRIANPRQNLVLDHVAIALETLREADAERRQRDREKRKAKADVPFKSEETGAPRVPFKIETGKADVPFKSEETSLSKLKTNTCREHPYQDRALREETGLSDLSLNGYALAKGRL